MPSSDPARRFEDIVANIVRIDGHVGGIATEVEFEENATVCDAVERCLQRISEAAAKLGAEAEQMCPEIPWAQVRAIGNVLRHEYDRVQPVRIWYTIKTDLPLLRAGCERALDRIRSGAGDAG